jgi:citrate synthase
LYERALSANDTAIDTMTTQLDSNHESVQDRPQMQWALQNNRARLLSALHRFPDALRVFVQLDNGSNGSINTNVTIISLVVRGITQFFCSKLVDSLNAFEQALTLAADHETQRAQVVLWLAQVLWALGTPEHQELAKQQLFSM